MISAFESQVRRNPQKTCFTYVDENGVETSYSYREVRMLAAALARYLLSRGVKRGHCVTLDLPNCPLFTLMVLAAAYGNFALVALNNRLTAHEKLSRTLELERCWGARISFHIDHTNSDALFEQALSLLTGGDKDTASTTMRAARFGHTAREVAATGVPRTTQALGRANNTREARRRRDEVQRQDALEEIIHFAERSSHVFDAKARALVLFTSGSTGKPKAVALTWDNLCNAAKSSNESLNSSDEGSWQAALPLYHVGGFEIVVRSFLAGIPFFLYAHFNAKRILADATRFHVSHLSVVDKMLQDMLDVQEEGMLSQYHCILLGGGPTNPRTLARALAAGARVYASYGMTETSSQIAHAQVTSDFVGGLRLLPGYEVHIVDPDAQGFGGLAVRGPGVFSGYLNARAAYTVDGYFLTGDTAALVQGLLFVKERTTDMFVSGGENVYPAEIRDKLLCIPGVSDAYVFGVPDQAWGRRPVAFVERVCRQDDSVGQASSSAMLQRFASELRQSLVPLLSKLYRPRQVFVLDSFPRKGIGKVDRGALESLYEHRIEVSRIVLYRIKQPFKKPFTTAQGTLFNRESLIIEVYDHAGRSGLGECVAFSSNWYLPETLDEDIQFIANVLAPLVLSNVYLHPSEVSASLRAQSEAGSYPLALGAIEPALWDLYGKIVKRPLWQLIGGGYSDGSCVLARSAQVYAGAVIGLGTPQETVLAARRCVEAGYKRVKLKVAPGSLAAVRAVRQTCPHVMLTIDANQSFSERDQEELYALDQCGTAWIEEPLKPESRSSRAKDDLFLRLSCLQRNMKTSLCLDESIQYPQDLLSALRYPELRCYAIKIGKMGGVQPTLEFLQLARARGLTVWMGGMYDTGISKRLHAAFETLPEMNFPGDIGAVGRYFAHDIADPPYTVERGVVTLNGSGNDHGIGCSLNRESLNAVLVDRRVIRA